MVRPDRFERPAFWFVVRLLAVRIRPASIFLFGLAGGFVLYCPPDSAFVHRLGCQFGCQTFLMSRATWAKVLTAMRQEFWSIGYRTEGEVERAAFCLTYVGTEGRAEDASCILKQPAYADGAEEAVGRAEEGVNVWSTKGTVAMLGPDAIKALKKKFGVKKDEELADKIGVSLSGIQQWKGRDSVTERQFAELVFKAESAGARRVQDSAAMRPIVEYFRVGFHGVEARQEARAF